MTLEGQKGRRGVILTRVVLFALVVLVFIGVGPYLISLFRPWTQVSCTHESIDIMSGRARTERYFWWIRISDRTEETAFSETYRKYVGEPPSPVWRRVNTFSPGARHSPNYVYHSAFGASRIILQAFQRAQFSDEARRKLLTTFLGLLQSDGNDNRADAYAHEIVQLVMTPGRNSGAMIEAKDLPILRPNETSDSLTSQPESSRERKP